MSLAQSPKLCISCFGDRICTKINGFFIDDKSISFPSLPTLGGVPNSLGKGESLRCLTIESSKSI
jgi:hypothetical protein